MPCLRTIRSKFAGSIFLALAVGFITAGSARAALLIHLPMDEGSGAATANLGTLGGNATIQPGLSWAVGVGPNGSNAISYGSAHGTAFNDGILLPPAVVNNQLDNLSAYTVTMWMNLNIALPNENSMHTLFDTRFNTGINSPQLVDQATRPNRVSRSGYG